MTDQGHVPAEELRNWSFRALLEHVAIRQEEQIMALADLQAAVASLQQAEQAESAELASVAQALGDATAQIAALQQQIASGGVVSEADLDALTESITTVAENAQAATSAAQGSPPPQPGPTAPAAPTAPGGGTAPAPTGPPVPDRTLYEFDGDPSTVDQATWTLAPFVTLDEPQRQLYYFAGDSNPGDRNGDGVGGVWHAYDLPVQPAPGTPEA